MFSRYSRIVAAIVLCFFTWTSGGVFSVAHAAVDGAKKGKAQQQPQKTNAAEERFSRLTEELREALADQKATVAAKKERLKAAQSELPLSMRISASSLPRRKNGSRTPSSPMRSSSGTTSSSSITTTISPSSLQTSPPWRRPRTTKRQRWPWKRPACTWKG